MKSKSLSLVVGLALTLASLTAVAQNTTFSMVRSAAAAAAGCIPDARARVTINSLGNVEVMHLEAAGLPPKTEFDAFIHPIPIRSHQERKSMLMVFCNGTPIDFWRARCSA